MPGSSSRAALGAALVAVVAATAIVVRGLTSRAQRAVVAPTSAFAPRQPAAAALGSEAPASRPSAAPAAAPLAAAAPELGGSADAPRPLAVPPTVAPGPSSASPARFPRELLPRPGVRFDLLPQLSQEALAPCACTIGKRLAGYSIDGREFGPAAVGATFKLRAAAGRPHTYELRPESSWNLERLIITTVPESPRSTGWRYSAVYRDGVRVEARVSMSARAGQAVIERADGQRLTLRSESGLMRWTLERLGAPSVGGLVPAEAAADCGAF